MENLTDYESMVVNLFKEDFELCREMVENGVEYYLESGDDRDVSLILLNLRRIAKAGYKDFESDNYDRDVINKTLEALEIKQRI